MKQKPYRMKDNTYAILTPSNRYYVRYEKDRIVYYSLDGDHIPLAKGTCSLCKETIESKRCGHFVSCSCGKSHVDTDRWMPERHRYVGKVIEIE